MSRELTVITHAYDLLVWTLSHTARFPRSHRHGLGQRIEEKVHALFDNLIEAKFSSDKQHCLRDGSLRVEELRFLFRLAKDYVDDGLLFGDDKLLLAAQREEVRRRLQSLRLRLHPRKSVIAPVEDGFGFLGYRVFPTHRLLDKRGVRRFRRRLRRMQRGYASGRLTCDDVGRRIMSWLGHARHAASYRLLERVLAEHPFVRRRR